MQNFYSKLRQHLLPRIQDLHLHQQAASPLDPQDPSTASPSVGVPAVVEDACDTNFVFLKKDTIYHHKLTRFNFTTYDVRHGVDIINPGTSCCNVMLLADTTDEPPNQHQHHFLYARVIGTYHANVIYTGPGSRDFEARRLDFLWVRWFEVVDPASSGWHSSRLDSIRFPPINGQDAFGFVDPKDVLRGCHILPAFAKGKRHEDGLGIMDPKDVLRGAKGKRKRKGKQKVDGAGNVDPRGVPSGSRFSVFKTTRKADGVGVSRCAKDSNDYNRYYVGR